MNTILLVTKTNMEGNNFVERTTEVDTAKPPVYREGCEYKFNSRLIKVIVYPIKRIKENV